MTYLIRAIILAQLAAAQLPQAEISNARIRAKLYLPDPESGYYRATRFDWSGQIASLEWNGHNYFGQWFERYDPKLHDAIMGPVEEFISSPGYNDAKPGETFVRIGAGVVRKPDEPAYQRFHTYEIVDPGKWKIEKRKDRVDYTHELQGAGYAYRYRKTLRLINDSLVLDHVLKNTGHKTIATSVYQHNFFMLDSQPTGPDFVVRFPFSLRPTADLKGLAQVHDKEFGFDRELPPGQSVSTWIEGYGSSVADYDIRVENRKSRAGVRQTGDRAMSRLLLWSIRTTICPEAYVDLKIDPGKEATWRITYEFYELRE